MTNTSPLLSMIDTLVEQKTFSLDALEQIRRLRDSAAHLTAENERLSKALDASRTEISELRQKVAEYSKQADGVVEREKKVAGQELTIAVDKKELELTKAFKTELTGLMLAAFKNPVVRADMFGSTTVSTPHGTACLPHNTTTTHTTE